MAQREKQTRAREHPAVVPDRPLKPESHHRDIQGGTARAARARAAAGA